MKNYCLGTWLTSSILLTGGALLLFIWWVLFHGQVYGKCAITHFDSVGGGCKCVYGTCKTCYCVTLYGKWWPKNKVAGGVSHDIRINDFGNNGCWIIGTREQVEESVNTHYMGNKTCYQDDTPYGSFYFPNPNYFRFFRIGKWLGISLLTTGAICLVAGVLILERISKNIETIPLLESIN